MATRKTTAKRAAPRRAAAPTKRRSYRKKSGTAMIPGAAATIGAVVGMAAPIKTVLGDMSVNGAKSALTQATQVDTIKKTAIYTAGGYVAGEVIRRYAPKVIKTPAGKIAKKLPRLF